MKTSQIIDAVYEHETLHPLAPLRGLKDRARVRLWVFMEKQPREKSNGLAALCGGWEGSDELAESVEKVFRFRREGRALPVF